MADKILEATYNSVRQEVKYRTSDGVPIEYRDMPNFFHLGVNDFLEKPENQDKRMVIVCLSEEEAKRLGK